MKTIYSDQEIELVGTSLFLVGPSPRSKDVPSWRPEAIKILTDMNFPGTVLVPERSDGDYNFINQVEWEWEGLHNCTAIVCWVPRNLETMIGLTTNVEFGFYVKSGRVYYGRPPNSPKNDYLDWLYKKVTNRKPFTRLDYLLSYVVNSVGERCHSGRDGDCNWVGCPQTKDKEPETTGRHCPLDWDRDEDYQ